MSSFIRKCVKTWLMKATKYTNFNYIYPKIVQETVFFIYHPDLLTFRFPVFDSFQLPPLICIFSLLSPIATGCVVIDWKLPSHNTNPEGITKSLQTFSEEQFLLELSDDRSSSPVTRPPIRNRTPPYLDNLHLGFHQHQQHHHQHAETSENEIYDSDESNLLRTPLDRGPHFDLSASKNITALVGKTAYLNCRVKNIGNKTVNFNFNGAVYCFCTSFFLPTTTHCLLTVTFFAFGIELLPYR